MTGRSPRTEGEWVRSVEQRLRQLASGSRQLRVNNWVFSERDGKIILTKPGEPTLDAGTEPEPQEVNLTPRGGYITPEEVTEAVTGTPGPLDSITSFLTGKWSQLTGADTNATTALGNFTTILSSFGLGSVADWVTDLLGTKSTASTAGTNASTALGNWTTALSNAAEATVAAFGASLANAKSNASTAIGNFTSLFTGLSVPNIGGLITDLLGTKSTASTANTNASTGLGNWTSWLSGGSWANIAASVADFLGTKSTASTASTNATTALGTASTANTTANNANTKAQSWIDGFYNGYRGDTATGLPVADAQTQAAAIAETQAALASAIAALQSEADGETFNGVSGTDTFDRVTASGAGGAGFWTESWAGNATTGIYCDGADLRMKDSTSGVGGASVEMRCINPAFEHTLTSYQKITWTCGAISGDNPTGASSVMQHTRIKFRENDAETQYGFLEFGGNGLAQWGYRNGGSDTMVGSSFSLAEPTAGVRIVVIAGTNAGVRRYQVYRNGTFINEWNDSTTALVAEGASNLGWGMQLFWGTWLFPTTNSQHSPPSVGSMSISDNVPPVVKGNTARIYRASGTNVSFAAATSGQFVPANFFDTVDYCTPDITITFGRRMTVTKEGTYIVVGRILMGTWGANNEGYLGLYKNGVMARRGDGFGGSNIGNNTAYWEMSTWTIYLVPGDYVDLAYVHDATQSSCRGEASGTESYFEITRIA